MFEIILFSVFPAAMVFAAASDFFSMTISNRLTAGFAIAFLVVAIYSGIDTEQLIMHVSAGLAMLVLGFVLFALGWIGGGDAKFFAATAIWLGWAPLFEYTLWAALVGGLLTFIFIFARGFPLPSYLNRQSWAVRLHSAGHGVPYGIALAVAGLVIYPGTSLVPLVLGFTG